MRRPASRTVKELGCALLGAYAMAVGTVKFVGVMFALAAHPHPWPLSSIGCIAFWALVFEAGGLMLGVGLRILAPLGPERAVALAAGDANEWMRSGPTR